MTSRLLFLSSSVRLSRTRTLSHSHAQNMPETMTPTTEKKQVEDDNFDDEDSINWEDIPIDDWVEARWKQTHAETATRTAVSTTTTTTTTSITTPSISNPTSLSPTFVEEREPPQPPELPPTPLSSLLPSNDRWQSTKSTTFSSSSSPLTKRFRFTATSNDNTTRMTTTPMTITPPTMNPGNDGRHIGSSSNTSRMMTTTTKMNSRTIHRQDAARCLSRYFGYSDFRTGQWEAIQAILEGRDVAIFWSTGSGKSLPYIIPPLLLASSPSSSSSSSLGEGLEDSSMSVSVSSSSRNPSPPTTTTTASPICLVISPLISLMQDQVHKLNHLGFGNLATYLGSAQKDMAMESKALNGDFRLIYCTPEKLLQSPSFFKGLEDLSSSLCLIAIDEAHCVSDWGHDFRPEYRQVGMKLRSHPILHKIPIMALTATAMPRIQQDILDTLKMSSNVFKSLKSFDRPNLVLKVVPKGSGDGAIRSAMEPLVQELVTATTGGVGGCGSTIVYCPTKAKVEEVASFLRQRLQACHSSVQVEYYHADVSAQDRQRTHIRFLTGQTTVVVATIAFGMGIDKPDIRKVIHYEPPKTVEEYYQQIGRAGRDGRPAECVLYCTSSDFDRYQSDFYLKDLNSKARMAVTQSTKALKDFAMNRDKCRRRSLLEFFEEKPSFGDWCGTCDVCRARATFGDDAYRDFGKVARFLLHGIDSLSEQGMTTLLQVLGGKVVENFRYKRHIHPSTLQSKLQEEHHGLGKRITNDHLKEWVALLTQKGYVSEMTKRVDANGYVRTWTVFALTSLGRQVLQNVHQPIMLPVPQSVRDTERQAEIDRQRILEQLQEAGIELSTLPEKELEEGDGEVIQAYLKWNRRLEGLTKANKTERLQQVEELLKIIQSWRSRAATTLQVAPVNILAEHLVYSIAYSAQSLPTGMKLSTRDLEEIGARNQMIPVLVSDINDWLVKYATTGTTADHSSSSSTTERDGDWFLTFPSGPIKPAMKWPFAIYRPNKKTGLASWESSYNRFSNNGESPMTIAMAPISTTNSSVGKPLAVTTVIGHIQEALIQGRPVDLQRLSSFVSATLPSKAQWSRLEEAETEMQMSVVGDPTTSGVGGGPYTMKDLLQPIMGQALSDKTYDQRTPDEQQAYTTWFQLLQWYQLLKRAGIDPTFEKRPRI